MHILIPFAASSGPQCQQALAGLKLPHLEKLLQRLAPEPGLADTPKSLSPLHEQLAAKAVGLPLADGLIPWAAQEAQTRGLTGLHGTDGWAWITPCHWMVHADHVAMSDPAQLSLTASDYAMLWKAMEPYFAEDGITLFANTPEHPTRAWLAHGGVFKGLPTASLDRVVGQRVDSWLPRHNQAKGLRRLQNEMQMLLYTHVLNDERTEFKLPSINSFWVSGTGALAAAAPSAPTAPEPLTIYTGLRAAALQDNGAQWASAWQALDTDLFAQACERLERSEPIHIILCGEQRAICLQHRPAGLWARLHRRLVDPQAVALLKTL